MSRLINGQKRGASTVECAFCLPIILLLTFATLEICSAIFVKETLSVACYEGARVGVKRRATAQDAYDQCQMVLDARGIDNYTITITPDDFSSLNALDEIEVSITASNDANAFFVGQFFQGRDLSASVVMVREFDE